MYISVLSRRVVADTRLLVTPPHLVGYANGIAQSIVSLARFFGPIIGGLVRVFPPLHCVQSS